jgi:ABC-2 type transport system ATP-binding protein
MNYPIATDHLSRKFGRLEAVRDFTLKVPEGSLYALLGPNGAGKTTAIYLLMNLLRPTAGEAFVLGTKSTRVGPSQLAQIGYVSENQQFPGWMTVKQLLEFCKPLYPSWDDSLCNNLVRKFELPLDRKIRALSRGMRMKTAMIAGLAYHPRLLILDEPFTGLDVAVRADLIEGMLELAEQGDWTLFISSHDLEDIESLVDWIGFLDQGDLQFSEESEKLQARFREIEITFSQPATLPPGLPVTWLKPVAGGNVIRFIESGYTERESEHTVRQVFPSAGDISVSPLSLRSIFLALARTGKDLSGIEVMS